MYFARDSFNTYSYSCLPTIIATQLQLASHTSSSLFDRNCVLIQSLYTFSVLLLKMKITLIVITLVLGLGMSEGKTL